MRRTSTRARVALEPRSKRQGSSLREDGRRDGVAAPARRTRYSLDDQIGFLLRRAYQRATSNLVGRVAGYDLTPPQFAVLARLHECGPLSQNRLGRLVAMEPPNIRDVVLRLRRRGLVRVARDAGDGRLVLVSLTPCGASLIETLIPLEEAGTAQTLAPLRPRERRQLYDLLRRLAGDGERHPR